MGTPEKSAYVGERKNGYRHGTGEYTYHEGIYKYNGEWVEGKKHGTGTFAMRDVFTYTGDFEDGEMTGKGTKVWNDGREYSGSFVLGHMEGEGILRNQRTGEICEGIWKRNMLEGKGKRIYSNGSVYEGQFLAHKPHGFGVFTTTSGERYEGEFVNGKKEGTGKNIWDNGDEYEGEWEGDKREGNGKFVEKMTGILVAGKWVDDEPEREPKELEFITPNSDISIENTSPFPSIQIGIKASNKDRITEESGRIVCLSLQYLLRLPPPGSAKDKKRTQLSVPVVRKLQSSKSVEDLSILPPSLINISFQVKNETETITTEKLKGNMINGKCDFTIALPNSAEIGEYNLIVEDETPENSIFGKLQSARLIFHLIAPVKQTAPTKRTK